MNNENIETRKFDEKAEQLPTYEAIVSGYNSLSKGDFLEQFRPEKVAVVNGMARKSDEGIPPIFAEDSSGGYYFVKCDKGYLCFPKHDMDINDSTFYTGALNRLFTYEGEYDSFSTYRNLDKGHPNVSKPAIFDASFGIKERGCLNLGPGEGDSGGETINEYDGKTEAAGVVKVDEKILEQLLEDKKFVETIANLYKNVESWQGIYSVGVSPRALDSVTKLHEVVGEQYDQRMGKPISKNKVDKGLQQLTFAYIQRIIEEDKRQTSKAEIAVKTEQPKNAREALQMLKDSLFDDEKGEYGKFFEQILQRYGAGEEDKIAHEILGISHIFNKLKNREAVKLVLSAPFWEEIIKKEVKEDLHRTRPYYPYFPRFYSFIEALYQAGFLDKAKETLEWIIDWEEKAFSSKYKGKYAKASGAKEWLMKHVDNFKKLYEKIYPATTKIIKNPTEVKNEKTPPQTIEQLLEQIDGLIKEKELKKAQELADAAVKQLRTLLEAGEPEKIVALGPRIKEALKAITEALAEQKNEKNPLLSFISDLQTAIKKSAYQDWEADLGRLDKIAKLPCSIPPSQDDEAMGLLKNWGWNFYTSELGAKANTWEIFKKGMREFDILVLDSIGTPFNPEDHLNIRGNSNEIIKVIKPGFKVAAWKTYSGNRTIEKAHVVTS